MSDIVLLTAEADRASGRALFAALSNNGLDVRRAMIGESNDSARDAAKLVEEAHCVLLGWSGHSAASARFRALARHAALRNVAVGIEFEPGAYRAEYGPMRLYSYAGKKKSLRAWLGRRLFLNDIMVAARYKAGGEDPPPPTARHKLFIRELWFGFGSAATAAGLLVAFPDLYRALPWPRFDENEKWRNARTCEDLRDFREQFPNSDRSALAAAILERAKRHRVERRQIVRTTDIMVPFELTPASRTEAEARRVLARHAASLAESKCEGFTGAVPDWRVQRSSYRPVEPECRRLGQGHVCRIILTKAICTLEGPVEVETEECRIPR